MESSEKKVGNTGPKNGNKGGGCLEQIYHGTTGGNVEIVGKAVDGRNAESQIEAEVQGAEHEDERLEERAAAERGGGGNKIEGSGRLRIHIHRTWWMKRW
jgi:hypothetical protein